MCSHDTRTHRRNAATLERLGAEITELASHIHAATCRWLGLVAEFDRGQGWASWGCRSCAHWIAWRCSIDARAAREHVRVAHRLEELPLIRVAFAEGRLSYSKVRALSRVENVEREADLLELARHATAAQLDRLVRTYRGVVVAERGAAGGRPERYVTWSHADDGSLLLRARLPAEEGAVVLAALEAAVEGMAADALPARAEADGPAEPAAVSGSPAEPAAVSAPLLGSAEPPASESGPAEPPGLSGGPAEPPEVSAGPAEPPLSIVERRADALTLMADTLLAHGPRARGGDQYQVVVHVDAATLRDGSQIGRCELSDGTLLATDTARRLACDAAIVPLLERVGRPLSVGRKTRTVPPALNRALASRDRGCRFPGCTNRHVDAHHVHHWAHGGTTSLDNLVQLCRHHHRLLHEGGYTVETSGPGFVFRRPDGRRVRAVPRPPRGCARSLQESNRRHGRNIDPEASVPLWAGEHLDLGLGVQAMLSIAPPEAPGI